MKSTIINIKQLSLVALSAFILGSCTDKLDVNPTQTISSEQALKTEGDINATLIGAYDGIQSAAVYGGDIQVLNDLTGNSEDIQFTGTFAGLNDAYNALMASTNTFARDTWVASYNAINRTNNVLANLDKVVSSDANKKKVEGEALFLRASLHFELVRLFAKAPGDGDLNTNPGVPLILQPTLVVDESSYVTRATVKAVYDQVIADLTKAESLLPSSNSRYATKWAAAAQLSRAHLMLGNYAEARDAANRVITGSGKTLATDFSGLWFTQINLGGTPPAEYIFWSEVTTQDGVNDINTFFGRTIGSIPGTAGRSDCKIKASHLAKYEAGDTRNYFILSGGFNYTRKHLDRYGDVPVIRLAEMYLTRAEANQRLNTTVGATPLADVNRIRARAKLADLPSVTLDQILKERYLELAFEGHNLPDKKRLKQNVGTLAWNSPKLIFPIPQREIDVNKNLTQNEGY
ncbi:MAG TPA: RagB/SusD family nutrient uptake outer membrane protein [Chitinophagaceae bacterium]|nr:RagB/SusD family nutrient uptake outer membrane protein [Chitinophagaceae bacterium]